MEGSLNSMIQLGSATSDKHLTRNFDSGKSSVFSRENRGAENRGLASGWPGWSRMSLQARNLSSVTIFPSREHLSGLLACAWAGEPGVVAFW